MEDMNETQKLQLSECFDEILMTLADLDYALLDAASWVPRGTVFRESIMAINDMVGAISRQFEMMKFKLDAERALTKKKPI